MLTKVKFDVIFGLVTSIVDGDTFDVLVTRQNSGNQYRYNSVERIRISSINAPELPTISGMRAKVDLERHLSHKSVKLHVQARDAYGRLVSEVFS